MVWGDPHFLTLDGHGYTFNGLGEFTLLKMENDTFTAQIRTSQTLGTSSVPALDGMPIAATGVMAVAARYRNKEVVHIGLSSDSRSLKLYIDGVNQTDMLHSAEVAKEFGSVTVFNTGTSMITVNFQNGVFKNNASLFDLTDLNMLQ